MYLKKAYGYVLPEKPFSCILRKATRIFYESKLWKEWKTFIKPTTCFFCFSMNGRILSIQEVEAIKIPVHDRCGCHLESVTAILAGTATAAGGSGVDLYVARNGFPPFNYLTQGEAKKLGWRKAYGNLAQVLPGKLIGGDIYKNRDGRLPQAEGRIWYEADFDYSSGYRNNCRLLFSNDGLLFATYDHYTTFYEIGLEGLE